MGIFITFEGIDGSGKTSVSKQVADILRIDYKVHWTKEPTDQSLFTQLRRIQSNFLAGRPKINLINPSEKEQILSILPAEPTPQQEVLNFLLDRSLHAPKLRAAISENDIVICDRYHTSTLAYQWEAYCALFGIGKSDSRKAEALSDPAYFGWPVPDITILLEAFPEVAEERREKRDGDKFTSSSPLSIQGLLDSFERKTDLEAVCNQYSWLAESVLTNVETVDANDSFSGMVARCLDIITGVLNRSRGTN